MVILKKWYSSTTEVQLLHTGPKADSISFSQDQILLGR